MNTRIRNLPANKLVSTLKDLRDQADALKVAQRTSGLSNRGASEVSKNARCSARERARKIPPRSTPWMRAMRWPSPIEWPSSPWR